MSDNGQLTKANNDGLSKTQTVLVNFVQTVTGVATSDKKDLVRDISHVVQRGIQGKLATGFAEEYEALKKRGKIKEDYETTDQCRQQTSYVFDAINSDHAIDEKRFMAMKNIFLNAAQEKMTDRSEMLPIVLMRICSTLTEGELLVLEACYRFSRAKSQGLSNAPTYESNNPGSWVALITEESGLELTALVEQYEVSLLQKGLLNKRTAGGNIVVNNDYHLSDAGLKLCEFIRDYDPSV